MATNSTRSEAEDHLLQLLQMVNEWLRFAEAKNAALLGLSGLSLTAVLGFVTQVEAIGNWAAGLLVVGSGLWIASTLALTVSFLPRTDLLNITSRLSSTPDESDNLYYFAHLAKFDAAGLLQALDLQSEPEAPRYRFEKDLADQLIANSRITNDKLGAFQMATKGWGVGLVLVASGVLSVLWG